MFCPRSVALLLYSSPSLTLPFLHPQNTWNPGPHGPLLAHLDAHFSTCYPQLEKQIPIFLNSEDFDLQETVLLPEDLVSADEVFLCNSVRGLQRVEIIDNPVRF